MRFDAATSPPRHPRTDPDLGAALTALLHQGLGREPSRRFSAKVTAAALDLGYERAYLAVWTPENLGLRLCAAAGVGVLDQVVSRLQPSVPELNQLQHARLERICVRIGEGPGGGTSLLEALDASEILAVAVGSETRARRLLLVDRGALAPARDPAREERDLLTLVDCASLMLDNHLLRREADRSRRMAQLDSLTRLFNRRVGLELFQRELSRARRLNTALSLLMLDVDQFKRLNDTYGHVAGDRVLRSVADVIRRTFRQSDIVCRYGGEEFLVVQPDTDVTEAATAAARVFKEVEAASAEIGIPVTVSVGATYVDPAVDSPENAIHRADRALYASKGMGRNRFSVDGGS